MHKRARPGVTKKKPIKSKRVNDDDEIDSDEIASVASEDIPHLNNKEANDSDDEFFAINSDEEEEDSKMTMTRKFLEGIGAGDESTEQIVARVQKEADAASRKVHHRLADTMSFTSHSFYRGHKLSPTCVTLSDDGNHAFSGSKDCSIIRWDLETGKKDVFPGQRKQFECGGHFEKVLCVSYAGNENLLCSGGVDRVIRLWDVRSPRTKCIDTFKGHTGSVTGILTEPGNTHQIYSTSTDKTMRAWSLNMRCFTELFAGHTEEVTNISGIVKDRPLTIGNDHTIRLWKISASSHLLFHTPPPSMPHGDHIDACAMIHSQRFATGCVDGSIALWSAAFKKPVSVVVGGHEGGVSSLASVGFSDVLFSGGNDGVIKCWKADDGLLDVKVTSGSGRRKGMMQGVLEERGRVEGVKGFVTGLAVNKEKGVVVGVVGKEPRMARWEVNGDAMNGLWVQRVNWE